MRSTVKVRFASLAATLTAAGLLALPAAPAQADTAPPAGTPATVSADGLPTVQVAGKPLFGATTGTTGGVVWKTTVVGTTAYAVGSFATARPAGTVVGDAAEVPRANILAFDVTTGALLPFAPVLNGQALALKASPDGGTLYVGGDFTTVDGLPRPHLAAFDTATGALVGAFHPSVGAQVRALSVTATTVYAGGIFAAVGSSPRNRLAAFSRTDGALLPWSPTADDTVEALLAAPDDSRVVVGGRFQNLDGQAKVGVGAVDGATGAMAPWSSRPIPTRTSTGRSWVTDLTIQAGTVFASADGEGGHWFDGRFAADFATGDLVWLDNCYGATYGIFVQSSAVYSVSHAHDCSSLNAFPQTSPVTYRRALAETTYPVGTDQTPPGSNSNYSGQPIPQLLHWFPDVNFGATTGQSQGAWTISGNDTYVVLGGEFTKINGIAQQGLVRFAVRATAPNKVKPVYSPLLPPTGSSLTPGTIRVTWPATWDQDNTLLRYDLYRDSGTTPVYSVSQTPTGWTTSNPSSPTGPSMSFTDTGLVGGSVHQYRLKVSDPFGNNLDWMRTAQITVATALSVYAQGVLTDGASSYWRLGETGTTAQDTAGNSPATKGTGVTSGAAGAIGDGDAAVTGDGTSAGTVVTTAPVAAPTALTVEAWVRTTSTAGGKIVGYGSAATGLSGSYDRHLYLDTSGHVVWGVYNGGVRTVASAGRVNDGAYHHVVGTLGSAGMALYVDGALVGSDATVTAATPYSGYWRIGGDNLAGWPSAPASSYLAGTIDDVAVYPSALSASVVARHWTDTGRTLAPAPNTAPTARLTTSCSKLSCTLDASASSDADGTVASYRFSFGDGTTDVTGTASRVTHAYRSAGTYTVRVTVTDDRGATGTTSASVHPRKN